MPFRCPTIPSFDPVASLAVQPEPLPPIDRDAFLAADVEETAFGEVVIRDDSVSDFAPLDWRTDWRARTVEFFEISRGGPPRDGIPSLDSPRFVDVAAADEIYRDNSPVIQLEVNGDVRAYGLDILVSGLARNRQ